MDVEAARHQAGEDTEALAPADLAGADAFHAGGRPAAANPGPPR